MKIDEASMRKILSALQTRNAIHPCPRCGSGNITIAQQVVDLPLRGLDQPAAACAVLCTACGNMHLHLLGQLGIAVPRTDETAGEGDGAPRLDLGRFGTPERAEG